MVVCNVWWFQNQILILKIHNLNGSYFINLCLYSTKAALTTGYVNIAEQCRYFSCISQSSKLAAILIVLPVTTTTVEWTFSSMKLIKTRLQSRMGESKLEHAVRICIEGPDQLHNDTLEAVIDQLQTCKKAKVGNYKDSITQTNNNYCCV